MLTAHKHRGSPSVLLGHRLNRHERRVRDIVLRRRVASARAPAFALLRLLHFVRHLVGTVVVVAVRVRVVFVGERIALLVFACGSIHAAMVPVEVDSGVALSFLLVFINFVAGAREQPAHGVDAC